MDHSGVSSLHFRERDRAFPENSTKSSSPQSVSSGEKQIGYQRKRRPGVRTACLHFRHDEDIQTSTDKHDFNVQQPGHCLLFHGVHAVLDIHAEIY